MTRKLQLLFSAAALLLMATSCKEVPQAEKKINADLLIGTWQLESYGPVSAPQTYKADSEGYIQIQKLKLNSGEDKFTIESKMQTQFLVFDRTTFDSYEFEQDRQDKNPLRPIFNFEPVGTRFSYSVTGSSISYNWTSSLSVHTPQIGSDPKLKASSNSQADNSKPLLSPVLELDDKRLVLQKRFFTEAGVIENGILTYIRTDADIVTSKVSAVSTKIVERIRNTLRVESAVAFKDVSHEFAHDIASSKFPLVSCYFNDDGGLQVYAGFAHMERSLDHLPGFAELVQQASEKGKTDLQISLPHLRPSKIIASSEPISIDMAPSVDASGYQRNSSVELELVDPTAAATFGHEAFGNLIYTSANVDAESEGSTECTYSNASISTHGTRLDITLSCSGLNARTKDATVVDAGMAEVSMTISCPLSQSVSSEK